jgi:hypothetical protein
MGISISPTEPGRLPAAPRPGRTLAITSLVLVAAPILLYVPLYLVGWALMEALGVAEGELLLEAGVRGVLAWASMLVLVATPSVVGVVLGARARRLGEHQLGTLGVVLNTLTGAYVLLASILQTVIA